MAALTTLGSGSEPDFMKEINNASKEDIRKTAALVVEEQAADTSVFDTALEAKIPKFHITEIRLGRTLGRGGFCVVTEIEKVKIADDADLGSSDRGNSLTRRFKGSRSRSSFEDELKGDEFDQRSTASEFRNDFGLPKHGLSRKVVARVSKKQSRREGGKFALKQVSSELAHVSKMNYLKGLVDLSIEAKFLSAVDHPNIISLCGVSSCGFSDFIIIERLRETLSMRFRTWMKVDRQCKGITGVFTGSKNKRLKLNEDRTKAAYDIACGVEYLHSRNIIFRDLVRGIIVCIDARLFGWH